MWSCEDVVGWAVSRETPFCAPSCTRPVQLDHPLTPSCARNPPPSVLHERLPHPTPDGPIPDFWLNALANHNKIGPFITERDSEVLKYLEVRGGRTWG